MAALVEIDKLTKRFGSFPAVTDLSLEIEEGSVLGFIGPNGAGKSTTLKMLATIVRPSSGDARIAGHSIKQDSDRIRWLIGYMPDVCGLYEDMRVHEYLRFFANVYRITSTKAEKAIDETLDLVGLEGKSDSLCGELSRGMSQRLHLARVLLHDPKLLLLDEPASGLDPRARIDFKELVSTLRGMGKTLIISSHILSELGEMCDSIAIIEKSSLVYSGSVEAVSQQVAKESRIFSVRVKEDPERSLTRGDLLETMRSLPYVEAVREGDAAGEAFVKFVPDFDDVARLNEELVRRGFRVERFGEEKTRLEDVFLHLTKGLVQ